MPILPMDAPYRQLDTFCIECFFPCKNMAGTRCRPSVSVEVEQE